MSTPLDRRSPSLQSDDTLAPRAANSPLLGNVDEAIQSVPNHPPSNQHPAAGDYPFLSAPAEKDDIGRLGKFRVLDLLGMGGMGIVFLAEDTSLGRRVALKVMKPRPDDKQELSGKRFLREARALAKIKHDHLVTIYTVDQEGDTCYYAMELLAGETLESRINRDRHWDVLEIMRIGQELAAGLAAIHEHGLIHRDIKPANVWLENRDTGAIAASKNANAPKVRPAMGAPRVKILDFGLARSAKDDIALTETGVILGTPAFMAPEQVRGKKVDARSDLYSLGCILYRLCVGRYPHTADSTMAQLAAVVLDDPEPVGDLNPAIPTGLARLIMQLLSKDPEKRPKSAAAVVEKLGQLREARAKPHRTADTEAILKPRDRSNDTSKLVSKPTFWTRHSGLILIAASVGGGAAMLGIVIVIVAGWWWWAGRGPEGKDPPPKDVINKVVQGEKFFVSEMKPAQAVSWPFLAKKGKKPPPGKEFDADRVVVRGQASPRSIFMHAAHPFEPPASLSYQLDKKFQSFVTKVSLNDSAPDSKSPMLFTIYGDGKPLWKSKRVQTQADEQEITVPVSEIKLLKLEVTIQGEDIGGAHGAWIEPHLTKAAK